MAQSAHALGHNRANGGIVQGYLNLPSSPLVRGFLGFN